MPGQFIMGPLDGALPEGWVSQRLSGGLVLRRHPSLVVTRAEGTYGQVFVLGYALDPSVPSASQAEVTQAIALASSTDDELIDLLHRLSGRFLVLAATSTGHVVVPDAGGLRQAFYCRVAGATWLASSAGLLGASLRLPPDRRALEFSRSDAYLQMRGGRWWPGDATLPAGVRRLLPNHSLRTESGTVRRFFPAGNAVDRSRASVLGDMEKYLRGALLAAARRAPLTLLLTGGHDSRLLLAAARPIADEMSFVSIDTAEGQAADSEIASRLARRLGLTHEIVTAQEPSAAFWRAYLVQDGPAASNYAANAQALVPLVRGRWAVTGHVAGVAKVAYRGARFARRPTARRLSMETGTGGHPFAVRQYADWLSGLGDHSGWRVHDLAYWEGRVGSWVASWALEYDTVWDDVVMPFANRRLLETIVAGSVAHRQASRIELWETAIREWWPELLAEPFGGNELPHRSMTERARRSLRYLRAG